MAKTLRALLLLLFLATLFVPTLFALRWIAISQIYSYFVDSIANLTGINLYLIRACLLVLLLPFLYGMRLFFSLNRTKRRIGTAILTALAVGHNIGLYFATRQVSFTAKGEALKYFALTPEGVKYSDRPGVESVYGVQFKPVTPEVARNLRLLEKGDFKLVDPGGTQWFNPITGHAQLWYYRYPDGILEFYAKPGRHPFTNDPLMEVTKDLYMEWRERAKAQDQAALPGSSSASPPERRPTVMGVRERRLNDFKALVNRGITAIPGKRTIALVIDSQPQTGGVEPAQAFQGALRSDRASFASNLYRLDLLKAKGFFDELYQGDKELLGITASLSGVDYTLLGRLSHSFRKDSSLDANLISCDLSLNCRIADRHGNVILSDSLSAAGPGFTEASALENAAQALSLRFRDQILPRILQ